MRASRVTRCQERSVPAQRYTGPMLQRCRATLKHCDCRRIRKVCSGFIPNSLRTMKDDDSLNALVTGH